MEDPPGFRVDTEVNEGRINLEKKGDMVRKGPVHNGPGQLIE